MQFRFVKNCHPCWLLFNHGLIKKGASIKHVARMWFCRSSGCKIWASKTPENLMNSNFAPGEIRTPDQVVRRHRPQKLPTNFCKMSADYFGCARRTTYMGYLPALKCLAIQEKRARALSERLKTLDTKTQQGLPRLS